MKKIINSIGLILIVVWLLGFVGRFYNFPILSDVIIYGALVVGIILLIVSAKIKSPEKSREIGTPKTLAALEDVKGEEEKESQVRSKEKMDKETKKIEGLQEINVRVENIQEIRIGFTDPSFSRMLGSGEQYDKVVWGVIGSLNAELAKTLMAEPRNGPYSGGYRVLVSVFREDSMDQLYNKVSEWSKGMFSQNDIIIQEGVLTARTPHTDNVQRIKMLVVTVLECESENPSVIIGEKIIIKPA